MENLFSSRTTQTLINGAVVSLKEGQEIKLQSIPYWKCKKVIIDNIDYGFLSPKELNDLQYELSSGCSTSKNIIQ